MINEIKLFLVGIIGAFALIATTFLKGKKEGRREVENEQNEQELNLIKKNNEIKNNNSDKSDKDIIDGL